MKLRNQIPATSNETDAQIDKKLKDRFNILEAMTNAAIDGDVKSLIISGPAGLGKSHTVEEALDLILSNPDDLYATDKDYKAKVLQLIKDAKRNPPLF